MELKWERRYWRTVHNFLVPRTNLCALQIVDKTIMEADKDRDGKISFEEFTKMVENTDISMSMTLVCPLS